MRTGHYGKAVMAYRKLLQGPDAISFTPEEYGDILHNEGIAHFTRLRFWRRGRISAKPIFGTIKENRCSIICGFC